MDVDLRMELEQGEDSMVKKQAFIFRLKIFYSKLLKNCYICLHYRVRF